MSGDLLELLDDGTAVEADDRPPVPPRTFNPCAGCGYWAATIGGWCEDCYGELI